MESAQSKDDLANQSLDVVVAKVLFVEPECCHRPPIFIEWVVLRATLHSASSVQVYLKAAPSNSSSKHCVHRAVHALSGSRQIKRNHWNCEYSVQTNLSSGLSWLSDSPTRSTGFRSKWPQIFYLLVLSEWSCLRPPLLAEGTCVFAFLVLGCVHRISDYVGPGLRWRRHPELSIPFHKLDQMRSKPSCRRGWKRKRSSQFRFGTHMLIFLKHLKS